MTEQDPSITIKSDKAAIPITPLAQRRGRFFMAEDNPGDVDLMREAINETGFDVDLEVATDGAMAIDILLNPAHVVPDLISLNFNLPRKQGFEVLVAIKQTDRLKGVPVVMLTSSNDQTDRLKCQSADAYFLKSGDWNELLSIIEHLKALIKARPSTESKLALDTFWIQK